MTDATAQPQDAIKNLYLFFSRLFLNEVDAPILERIRSGELRAPLEEAGMDIKFLEGAAPTVLDDLAVEYNDDTIIDLYYYNETDWTFQWNQELLEK